jgi:hypothetical protein
VRITAISSKIAQIYTLQGIEKTFKTLSESIIKVWGRQLLRQKNTAIFKKEYIYY